MYELLTVLENWQPKKSTRDSMHLEIWRKIQYIVSHQFKPKFEGPITVRDPQYDCTVRQAEHDQSNTWHQDDNGADIFMIVWSSILPTMIRPFGGGPLVEGLKDGDIMVLPNNLYEHKTPIGALGERWFARTTIRREYFNG